MFSTGFDVLTTNKSPLDLVSELKVDGNDIPIFPIAIPLSLSLPIDIYYDSDFWFTLGRKGRLWLRRLIDN